MIAYTGCEVAHLRMSFVRTVRLLDVERRHEMITIRPVTDLLRLGVESLMPRHIKENTLSLLLNFHSTSQNVRYGEITVYTVDCLAG